MLIGLCFFLSICANAWYFIFLLCYINICMRLLTAYFHCQDWENKASVLYNRHPSEKIDGTLFCLKNLIGLFLYTVFHDRKLREHSVIQEKHRKQRKRYETLISAIINRIRKTQFEFQLIILIYNLTQWKINRDLVMGE